MAVGFASEQAEARSPSAPRRAAQYLRMSTDHQRYSTANQAAALERYAEAHGLTITETYADEGKSGLSLAGRAGLLRLIADVQGGDAGFDILLVYDVSRWGRFQDADESAYYEYLCRRAGVTVIYCAEPFENDGTPIATIIKSVKRAMAGEFSRELSAKVFAGQSRLVRLGYKQGGSPGFGYRRQLVDSAGNPKALLQRGQRKSLQDDRVVLVPGPSDEVSTVREIFEAFVLRRANCQQIANDLNARRVSGPDGRNWSGPSIQGLLTNERYIGNNVFGRSAAKLRQRRSAVPREDWIRCDGAHPALVDETLFASAQRRLASRANRQGQAELLARLEELRTLHGGLSARIINQVKDGPRAGTYAQRFGSLEKAFAAVDSAGPGARPGAPTPVRRDRSAPCSSPQHSRSLKREARMLKTGGAASSP